MILQLVIIGMNRNKNIIIIAMTVTITTTTTIICFLRRDTHTRIAYVSTVDCSVREASIPPVCVQRQLRRK